MKGIIVCNSYYNASSYTDNIKMYHKGIVPYCTSLDIVTSADIMPYVGGDKITSFEWDFAVYLDKDICLAKILENSGVRVFNPALSIGICDNKAYTHSVLSSKGIPMPETYITPFTFSNIGYTNYDFLDKFDSFPVVVKRPYGSLGQQVYLAKDKSELLNIAKNIPDQFIIQEYIECDGTDTRVFVCGGKVVCAMERHNGNDFRSNVELGGTCKKVTPDSDIISLAEETARLLNLDFCGIDIVTSNGKNYLLEVNSNSMINGLSKVCGINPAEKLGEHILNTIKPC